MCAPKGPRIPVAAHENLKTHKRTVPHVAKPRTHRCGAILSRPQEPGQTEWHANAEI